MGQQDNGLQPMPYDSVLGAFYGQESDNRQNIWSISELDEQKLELARMNRVSKMPKWEQRWVKKTCRLAPLFWQAHPGQGLGYFSPSAVEAAFILSRPAEQHNAKLFLHSLDPQSQAWVAGAVADFGTAFFRSRLKSFDKDAAYNPLTIAQGLTLALDDELFNKVHPNLIVLAEMNAYQQHKHMWPQALGNKVQHVLSKRLSKEFEPLKYYAASEDAAQYIEDRWLDPIMRQAGCSDADVIRMQTVCMAARYAKIPLNAGYLWHVEEKSKQSNNPPLIQALQKEVQQHKILQCRQKVGIWDTIVRKFLLRQY